MYTKYHNIYHNGTMGMAYDAKEDCLSGYSDKGLKKVAIQRTTIYMGGIEIKIVAKYDSNENLIKE